MNLIPIDTPYKGHLFRSRLEARWAVFFDQLGLKWEYEPEGFVLPDGTRYLPDFRVKTPQGSDMWIEVKRADVTSDEKFGKFRQALTTGSNEAYRPVLVSGTPLDWLNRSLSVCPRCGVPFDEEDGYGDGRRSEYLCYPCDWEGGIWAGPAKWPGYSFRKGWVFTEDAIAWDRLLKASAIAAQSARFEHGEEGVVRAKPAAKKQKSSLGKRKAAKVGPEPLPGMCVTHSSFGTGLVTHVFGSPLSRAGMSIAVKFPDTGPKILSYPSGSSLGEPIHVGRCVYSVLSS